MGMHLRTSRAATVRSSFCRRSICIASSDVAPATQASPLCGRYHHWQTHLHCAKDLDHAPVRRHTGDLDWQSTPVERVAWHGSRARPKLHCKEEPTSGRALRIWRGGCRCSPGRMGCLGVGDPLLKNPEVLPVLCARAGNLCSALSKQQPTNEGRQVPPQLNRHANLEGMSIVWTESKGTVFSGSVCGFINVFIGPSCPGWTQ